MQKKGNAGTLSALLRRIRRIPGNQVARADLKKIFYKNETTFTFEKYFTKLKVFLNVL